MIISISLEFYGDDFLSRKAISLIENEEYHLEDVFEKDDPSSHFPGENIGFGHLSVTHVWRYALNCNMDEYEDWYMLLLRNSINNSKRWVRQKQFFDMKFFIITNVILTFFLPRSLML